VTDLIGLADHFGPWVVIAGVMLWYTREERKAARQRELDEIERQKADRELARERIGTDRQLAGAMSELAAEVRGMKR
jgi:hypothetical protein